MLKRFEGHDCSVCNQKGECMLEGAIEFLNDHKDEVKEFLSDSLDDNILQNILAVAVKEAPPIMLCMEAVTDAIGYAVTYGYCKGRTYQDVPKVFKEA